MQGFEEIITEYWGFIFFLLGLIFHALWTYFRVDDYGKRIKKLEDEHSETVNSVSDLKDMIGRMEAKLDILVEGYSKRK